MIIVTTRHLRPWLAKQTMPEDDFSQIIGRNMYLQDRVVYYCSIGKCTEKGNMLQKSHYLQKDNAFRSWLSNLSKPRYVFLVRQNLGRQIVGKYLRNA